MSARVAPLHLGLLLGATLVFAWSGILPKERATWWLEVFPALIALPVLVATYARFRLTDLVYALIALHACVLFVGGHYTYAEVPLGDWARDAFGLARNDYDRLGHFMQGFVPAMVAREVVIRLAVVRGKAWTFVIVSAICLSISASYELFEWGTALLAGSGAASFLGTQGDPWDTQADMLMALIGALSAQLLLGRWHDRALAALARRG